MLEHFSKQIDDFITSHSIAWDIIHGVEKQYLYQDITEWLHNVSYAHTLEQQQLYTHYLIDFISCEHSFELLQHCIENTIQIEALIDMLRQLDNSEYQDKVRLLYYCIMKEYFIMLK